MNGELYGGTPFNCDVCGKASPAHICNECHGKPHFRVSFHNRYGNFTYRYSKAVTPKDAIKDVNQRLGILASEYKGFVATPQGDK